MTSMPVNAFNAAQSMIDDAPTESLRSHVETTLDAPVSRRHLLDVMTAQATISVSISAVLVAMATNNQADTQANLGKLLEDLSQLTQSVGRILTRLMVDPVPSENKNADA